MLVLSIAIRKLVVGTLKSGKSEFDFEIMVSFILLM